MKLVLKKIPNDIHHETNVGFFNHLQATMSDEESVDMFDSESLEDTNVNPDPDIVPATVKKASDGCVRKSTSGKRNIQHEWIDEEIAGGRYFLLSFIIIH